MDKSEIRIFIVEDDPTMGKAIVEGVRKLGFQPVVCTNPTDALNQFRIQGSHFFIVDCMLPKMSGIELAVKLKTDSVDAVPLILISGIYKDKSFIKDALHKTKAIAFLTKPFNMSDLQRLIQEALADLVDEEVSPLENLLISVPTPGEKIKVINSLEQIEAYDIPWLCCLLMSPSISGTLQFSNEKGKAAISFGQGKVVQVEMQNPESFFGALLIEKGFLTPQQLETALAVKSNKRVGERLVELNLLSPHVIDLINAEQTAIRLSRFITDTIYNVTFVEKKIESNASSLEMESLAPYLIDWINTKIQSRWLEQRYLKWLNSSVMKVPGTIPSRRLWGMAPLKDHGALVKEFEDGASLSQVLSKGQYKDELIYQIFHLLILCDHIRLKREIKVIDESSQTKRLQKILSDMQNNDYFSILGVAKNAKPNDIKKTYHELAKIFHPDKVPANASSELKNLAQQVFGHMTKAYETLSNDIRKATYVKEIELGKSEKILQAEGLLEEGKALLKSGSPTKAKEKFEEAMLLRPPTSELLIHLAWTKLQTMESQTAAEENLRAVESILNKIPPEDRHNATYYFVKGLFQNMLGEDAAAKKNIQHALSLNPKFIEAQRVYRVLELKKTQKSSDFLHGDLKDVVTGLFKRPK